MLKKENKKKFEPTVRADDQVVFGEIDENDPADFTEFEYLKTQVAVLKETVENLVSIIRVNNLVMTKTIEADYPDDDEVFKRLESEREE